MFTIAHAYYIPCNLISFFVVVPIAPIAVGIVVWRTRSLSSTLTMHAVINSATGVFMSFFWRMR